MYRRFIAMKVRQSFAEITAGNWEPAVAIMAPEFTYVFYGDHALSGERHTPEALRAWWSRATHLIPNPQFTVDDVLVVGYPWSTRVATAVTVTATVPGGHRYHNVVHQFMRMRWGRIVEVRTLEDTVELQRALDASAAAGFTEAHADPITDESAV